MEKSNDTIGNRTRELLVSREVPQPTAPPAACQALKDKGIKKKEMKKRGSK